ncbi:hypothetical protein [Micromonospora sp. KC213]|uniref:hypothetical protein n=1 Tax=Micromonospora sp. KC213 TaxID=2530378 RepID=UPI00104E2649|nr:hypothetical protein [Micromonospora sp. KC213]TDC30207.1 hypothetical protein E1166_29170 [Micromonospora sp. KC213]
MKRIVTLVLAGVVAMTAALIPAGAASAHAGPHTVSLDLHMFIKDSESWPDPDHEYADLKWERELKLTVAQPSASTQFVGCAGREVRVVVDVFVSHDPDPWANHDVEVMTKTRLYEGESCQTDDLEKTTYRSFVAREYVGGYDHWVIKSDESGDDHASIALGVNQPLED